MTLKFILSEVRISALHQDPNAAGSYFALILVPAFIIALRHRSIWLTLGVIPLVVVAFLVAQSRAAMLAIGIVLGLVAMMALLKSRRFVLAASVLIADSAPGTCAAYAVTRSSHASLGRAAAIRQEMSLLAFDMTRDHPAFGVGIGNFRSVSRHYVTDEYPQLRRWAPSGTERAQQLPADPRRVGHSRLARVLVAGRARRAPVAVGAGLRRRHRRLRQRDGRGPRDVPDQRAVRSPLAHPTGRGGIFSGARSDLRAASGARLPQVASDKSCSGPQSSVWSFRCPGGFSTRGRRRATTKD